MKNPASFHFNNNTSVRFNLESFALPVALTKKKNSIYTATLDCLRGTKNKLLPAAAPVNTFGYTYAAYWGNWVFCGDSTGLYVADPSVGDFTVVNHGIIPQKLCIANDRLFSIGLNRKRLVYSENLRSDWTPANLMVGVIHLPEAVGLCLDIVYYRNNLLVVCENGLLTVNRGLTLSHISDDSELQLAHLQGGNIPLWASDWFSLGYATDTQSLREVFLKTNQPLTLVIESNRTKRTIRVNANNQVQKIRTNLRGDQFRLTLLAPTGDFCVSDLAAIVQYGKRE